MTNKNKRLKNICPFCQKPVRATDSNISPVELKYKKCHLGCWSKDKELKINKKNGQME